MNQLTATLEARMQDMGLEFMATGLESYLEAQARSDNTLSQSIADLLDIEFIPRRERAAKSRLKLSGMPAIKRLEDFSLEWIKSGLTAKQLMGPSGLGKTYLMLALAYKACMTEHTVWYTICIHLIEELGRAREQANLFFQVINARYEYGSIILTTNKGFGRWAEILGDEAIATATLDRLLHHAHVFSLKGNSYRMKDRMKIGVVDPV